MAGLEVSVAVTAVVSAFQSGAGLIETMKKRHRRRKGEEAYKEKALLESLESGATQIEERYTANCKELGPTMRVGDDIARNRLLHIAVTVQSEIIRSLQIGVQNEAALIDFTALHEASVMNKRDTLTALTELRERIFDDAAVDSPIQPVHPENGLLNPGNSRCPITSSDQRPRSLSNPSKNLPSAVTIPDEEEPRGVLGRMFSHRRTSSAFSRKSDRRPSPQSSPQVTMSANMPWISYKAPEDDDLLTPLPQELPQELPAEVPQRLRPHSDPPPPPAYSPGRNIRGFPQEEKKAASAYFPDSPRPVHPLERDSHLAQQDNLPTQNSAMLAPDCATTTQAELNAAIMDWTGGLQHLNINKEMLDVTPISRNTSTSTGSRYSNSDNLTRASSTFSASSDNTSPYPVAAPPSRNSYNSFTNSSPYSTAPPVNEMSPTFSPYNFAVRPSRYSRSSTNSTESTASANGPASPPAPTSVPSFTVPQQPLPILGRPCKSNNYWNFCKGSWSLREDFKKGLALRTKPVGMYTSMLVWQCKECAFEGASFGAKKPYIVDPNVHELVIPATGMGPEGPHPGTRLSFGSGEWGQPGEHEGRVRYKWLFLAKSHVKVKAGQALVRGENISSNGTPNSVVAGDRPGYSYGCILCCAEGRLTGVFGNAETLLRHVYFEHARKGVRDEVKRTTRCVVGRLPERGEEWDVNVLGVEVGGEGGRRGSGSGAVSRLSEDSR